jgi:signal transduction histidine kinase
MGFLLAFLVERERKRQQELIEAESLAAIGRTVSEIAHDMKTPLMAIGGYANLISRHLADDDPARAKLDVIIRETSRMEAMVKEMLDFSRPISIKPEQMELSELIRDTVEVTQPMAAEADVQLTSHLTDIPVFVYADMNKMRQVLVNLLTNAVQASPPGETVAINMYREDQKAVITISDCGCGIPEDIADTVFQPFFSTKERGTGLGLSVVKRIVDAHQGNVFFQQNPDKGVSFFVKLPLREEST